MLGANMKITYYQVPRVHNPISASCYWKLITALMIYIKYYWGGK